MSTLPGIGMFCVAGYTYQSSTAPGQFSQFDSLGSVTALFEYANISSLVIDASIHPQDYDEYCDKDDDGNNESDSDVENISALLNSAPAVVKNPKDLRQKQIPFDIDGPLIFSPIKTEFQSCILRLPIYF